MRQSSSRSSHCRVVVASVGLVVVVAVGCDLGTAVVDAVGVAATTVVTTAVAGTDVSRCRRGCRRGRRHDRRGRLLIGRDRRIRTGTPVGGPACPQQDRGCDEEEGHAVECERRYRRASGGSPSSPKHRGHQRSTPWSLQICSSRRARRHGGGAPRGWRPARCSGSRAPSRADPARPPVPCRSGPGATAASRDVSGPASIRSISRSVRICRFGTRRQTRSRRCRSSVPSPAGGVAAEAIPGVASMTAPATSAARPPPTHADPGCLGVGVGMLVASCRVFMICSFEGYEWLL